MGARQVLERGAGHCKNVYGVLGWWVSEDTENYLNTGGGGAGRQQGWLRGGQFPAALYYNTWKGATRHRWSVLTTQHPRRQHTDST